MKKIMILAALIFLITGCVNNQSTNNTTLDESSTDGIKEENNFTSSQSSNKNQNEQLTINQETLQDGRQARNMNKAKIETSMGNIIIELNQEKAPITVENFKKYASSGFYNGTLFHRIILGFMIQGGGFNSDKTQKETNAPIKNEANNGLRNDRGTIAMARTNVIDSATSQFFINLMDNESLNYQGEVNYGYAVFGKVIDSMEVVDKIARVKTGNNGVYQDWPVEDVIIEKIVLVE